MALMQNMGGDFTLFSPLPEKATKVHADGIERILPNLYKKENMVNLEKKSTMIDLDVAAKAYMVVDMKDQSIISEKNSDTPLPVASLTKIMTAVVALDLASSDEYFTVSERASKIPPTKIGVVPGEKMQLSELLHAVLLTSANDATEVVREGIDTKYGESIFVRAMNEKAKILGLTSTHFVNPQGFDARGQLSSARDLAILSLYAMENYPEIRDIARKDYQFLPESSFHKQFDLQNWNGLIGVYPNAFGLKTGITENAGNTTIVMASRDDTDILTVVLGTESIVARDLAAATLLDAGFAASSELSPIAVNESMLQARYGQWKFYN